MNVQLASEFLSSHKNISTPFLLMDLNILRRTYKNLKNLLSGVEVFYAMKANDHPVICKTLLEEKASFEVSSLNETRKLVDLGVNPENIFCLNPIKSPEFLSWMSEKKIRVLAIDSYDEVDKIAKYAPTSKVVVRITVPESGSTFPLGNRYGVSLEDAVKMLFYAFKRGLQPYGITFHVGSQNPNYESWVTALSLCRKVYGDLIKQHDLKLDLISLGGGVPIKYREPIPSVTEMARIILKGKKELFGDVPNLRFTIEPGRGIVGTAGIMVTTVVGRSERGGEQWLFIDCGVYNGLMEITGGFKLNLVSLRKGKNVPT